MTRRPSLPASLTLVFAGLLVIATAVGVTVVAASARAQAQATLEVAMRNAKAQAEARRMTEALAPRVRALSSTGAFRQASRLDWAEVLDRAAGAMQLPSLQWRIAARTPLPGFEKLGTVSAVFLDLALLHEGDLLRLENWLQRHAPGPWQLRVCELRAASRSAQPNPQAFHPRVTAHCELQAYTFRGPGNT